MSQDLATIRPKGNATVPNDAPIQPPQAFADALGLSPNDLNGLNGNGGSVGLQGYGITHISPYLLAACAAAAITAENGINFNLSNNALSSSECNEILEYLVAANLPFWTATLDLSGADMSDPTGQGLLDVATLTGNGWTIYTHSNPPPP